MSQHEHDPQRDDERRIRQALADYTMVETHTTRFRTDTTLEGYLKEFSKFSEFIDYIKSATKSRHLLEIGAGQAIAINELTSDPLGEGLTLNATGLVHPYKDDDANKVPYLLTSSEYLQGIDDNSVGGILAARSITYTPSRLRTVETIDRVLEPGGVCMASLIRRDALGRGSGGFYYTTAEEFDILFKEKGYETVIQQRWPTKNLIAIKPGREDSLKRQSLLQMK